MSVYKRRSLPKDSVWDYLKSAYGDKCVYCHVMPATFIEHVIPYSYCGYHGVENLSPSCARCNLIAGAKVFESFGDKYDYIRRESKKRKYTKKNRMLTCRDCLVPYYSALCHHAFLCPWCVEDKERYSTTRREREDWLRLLDKCGYVYEAHTRLRDFFSGIRGTDIPRDDRIRKLVEFYSELGAYGEVFVPYLVA